MTAKELHKISDKDLIEDEVEAIDGYDKAIEESDNPEAIAVYEHIKNEEVEHIAELEELDKMKAEDITSEQAWQDFKAGYTDFEEKHVSVSKGRDGDQASLGQKIDLMNAKLTELNTDVSRLNDAIPQALGTIEEAKTEETEAEEEMAEEGMGEEGMEMGGEEGEEDVFGEEDDGLSEFFDESDEGEESEEEGEDIPEDSEGEDNFEAESDEEGESEEPAEEGDFEEEGEEVADEDEDDDFISIDELDSEEESEGEEEDEDEQDEILEKMVQVLKKMDMRLTRLERENAGLKKQLSKGMTVQATPAKRSEQRQGPRNLRLVKGSYNRPPVSTQYVANQRDIGVMKSEGSGENTSVFKQELNEVFAECNRIANQTR